MYIETNADVLPDSDAIKYLDSGVSSVTDLVENTVQMTCGGRNKCAVKVTRGKNQHARDDDS